MKALHDRKSAARRTHSPEELTAPKNAQFEERTVPTSPARRTHGSKNAIAPQNASRVEFGRCATTPCTRRPYAALRHLQANAGLRPDARTYPTNRATSCHRQCVSKLDSLLPASLKTNCTRCLISQAQNSRRESERHDRNCLKGRRAFHSVSRTERRTSIDAPTTSTATRDRVVRRAASTPRAFGHTQFEAETDEGVS